VDAGVVVDVGDEVVAAVEACSVLLSAVVLRVVVLVTRAVTVVEVEVSVVVCDTVLAEVTRVVTVVEVEVSVVVCDTVLVDVNVLVDCTVLVCTRIDMVVARDSFSVSVSPDGVTEASESVTVLDVLADPVV